MLIGDGRVRQWYLTAAVAVLSSTRVFGRYLIVCVAAFTFPVSVSGQQKYQADQIDLGASLYGTNCAVCHADGAGIPGVDLRSGRFRRATSDDDLVAIIRNGITGTAMPAHTDFSSANLIAIVAYLRNMRDYGFKPVQLGDAAKGKALFENEGGCLNCHQVNGKGSHIALDLSSAGAVHPASYLQRALLDPESIVADMPQSHFMRAVTKSGQTITGRRLNEDTFTIQLMDEHENLLSLEKSNLRSLTIAEGTTMPSMKGKYTDDQISDLVAYLASLQRPGFYSGQPPIPRLTQETGFGRHP
jgi:putative heme-binding domain-containing protein